MLTIRHANKFRRDYRREKSGRHGRILDAMLDEVLDILESHQPFPRRYCDHPLSGAWNDCRDCHLKPDLVLIYHRLDEENVEFVRLGSHSELGL